MCSPMRYNSFGTILKFWTDAIKKKNPGDRIMIFERCFLRILEANSDPKTGPKIGSEALFF